MSLDIEIARIVLDLQALKEECSDYFIIGRLEQIIGQLETVKDIIY